MLLAKRVPAIVVFGVLCCRSSVGVAASAAASGSAAGSGLKPIDQHALQAMLNKTARELHLPGALILLRTPQGQFTASYGTTQLGDRSRPRPHTYFRIASITKTMTSAVILQLAQEGKLRLGDRISKYVSGVPNGNNITLAQLLEMRSGLNPPLNSPPPPLRSSHSPSPPPPSPPLPPPPSPPPPSPSPPSFPPFSSYKRLGIRRGRLSAPIKELPAHYLTELRSHPENLDEDGPRSFGARPARALALLTFGAPAAHGQRTTSRRRAWTTRRTRSAW